MDVDEGVEEKRRRDQEIRAEMGGFYGRDCELSWYAGSRMVIKHQKAKAWHMCRPKNNTYENFGSGRCAAKLLK